MLKMTPSNGNFKTTLPTGFITCLSLFSSECLIFQKFSMPHISDIFFGYMKVLGFLISDLRMAHAKV